MEIDDNCSGWNPAYPGCAEAPENPCGQVLYSQQVYEGDCTTQFQVVRTWTAIDAAGNSAQHTQVISVQDTEGPSFDNVPMDVTIACGDLNHIPAMPEDCAGVDLSFTQTVAEEGCSPYGLIVRTYTAVDGCGNESTFLQTLHTVDDEAPVVALDEALLDMSCGMYSEDNDYGLTVSDCSLQAWAESDGVWTRATSWTGLWQATPWIPRWKCLGLTPRCPSTTKGRATPSTERSPQWTVAATPACPTSP